MKPKQKTLLSVITVIFMLMTGISVFAEDGTEEVEILTSGDYSYSVINGGAILKEYTNFTETVITIPEEIDGYPVKALDKNLFYSKSDTDTSISKVIAEKIIIPASVEEIGTFAFYGCVNVKEYEVAEDSPAFCDVDGVMYDKNQKMLMAYPLASEATEYTVADGAIFIDYGAFSNCKAIENIVLPDSLETIGEWAFAKCINLKEISLPDKITKINRYTFAYCVNLTDIKWSSSLTTIDKGAFGGCTLLTEITLPDSIIEIGQGVFSDCIGITKVNLPEGLNTLNEGAFSGCTSLNEIELPSKLITIGEKAVGYNYNISKELVKNANFKIHGKTGSTAETYANENLITFVSTGDVETQPVVTEEAKSTVPNLNTEDNEGGSKALKIVLSVVGFVVIAGVAVAITMKKKKA